MSSIQEDTSGGGGAHGAIPIYRRLADELRRKIDDGVYAPGHCIGAENDLCQSWGVSRSTVRRALTELADTGLLVSRQGLGWFVSEPRFHQRLADRKSTRLNSSH